MRPVQSRRALSETELREATRGMLQLRYPFSALILEELQLYHKRAVLDLGVIDGALHGYEIKSDLDSLRRLPRQIEVYGRSCDTVTLVTTMDHAANVSEMIPKWWGLVLAEATIGSAGVELRQMQAPAENPTYEARELVSILRRTELLRILRANLAARRLSSAGKQQLVSAVLDIVGPKDARRLALEVLRLRRTWTARQLGLRSEADRLQHATTRPAPRLSTVAMPLFY